EAGSLLPPWQLSAEDLERYFLPEEMEGEEEEEQEQPPEPVVDPAPLAGRPLDDRALLGLQRTYGAAVTVADTVLGAVLEFLRDQEVLDETLVIFTSDRGFSLGEHGVVGEGRPWLHEEVVHVPLLMRLPGDGEGGLRVPTLTQPVDLMPT